MRLTRGFITNLADFFVHQDEMRFIWPALFLGLGAALYFTGSAEPLYTLTITGFVFCAVLWGGAYRLYHHKEGQEPFYLLHLLCAALLLTATGFGLSQLRSVTAGTPMIEKEGRPVMLTGRLAHLEDQEGGKGKQVLIDELNIDGWAKDQTPKSVRLTVRTVFDDGISVGDRVSMLAKLMSPSRPVMPGSFDYARHFYFEGIGGLGFSLSKVSLVEKGPAQFFSLDHLRSQVSAQIKSAVSGPSQGIVVALMTGERAAIADDDWQALRASGLAHIISISGLHVAMVAAPVFFLVRFLLALVPVIALRFDIKKIAALVALIVCSLYVGFVVPSVPTTRSLLMTGVGLIAIMLDRSPFSMRLVGLSAVLILIFSPESIWSASFQMSFAAVTALVFIANVMRPVWLALYREAGWFKKSVLFLSGAILTSFVASLATAPFVWFHFQQMATYSVLGNFLAMPLSGLVIMLMMLLAYFVMPFGLAVWPLKLMALGVDWLLDVARFVEGLPGALVTGPVTSPMFIYLSLVAGLWLLLARGWYRAVSMPFAVLAGLVLFTFSLPVVLVSESGEVVVIRDRDVAYFSTQRKDRFVREQYAQRLGVHQSAAFPAEGVLPLSDGHGYIACDDGLCRAEFDGHKIAMGKSYSALAEDCGWADIIITPNYLERDFCRKAQVINMQALRQYGAVAIDRNGSLVSVRKEGGNRPWF